MSLPLIRYNLKESQRSAREENAVPEGIDWPPDKPHIVLRLLSAVYTFSAFVIALSLVPWLFCTFLVVKVCRILFVNWLQKKYQDLEFIHKTTVRTTVDTQRNQGIITVLLTVKGPCQLHFIKNRIQADIVERERNNRLVFPHLRNVLTSRWGNYAWVKGSEKYFKIDNHIVLASSTFKGRPVSDANIQEYVSDIIAKLLPPDKPPWQITLIPTQLDKTYLLIRLHHLYTSEDGLSLGELLLLRNDERNFASTLDVDPYNESAVLAGVFRAPVVIPQVYEHVCEFLSNWWNEMLYVYDPVDNPNASKQPQGLKAFLSLLLIISVSTARAYCKGTETALMDLLKIEQEKRGVTKKQFWLCLGQTLSLANLTSMLVILMWFLPLKLFKFPANIVKVALDTPVYLYWLYLTHFVIQESFYLFKICYTAPRVIFEEIFLPESPSNVHQLQAMSFCGRKVVNWSAPVSVDIIKRVRWATGCSNSEVVMSAVANSLRDYFEGAGFAVPDAVMTTCHFMPQEDLFASKGQPSSGMLCLQFPTLTPKNDPMQCLRALRTSLYKAKSTQAPLYLASLYNLDYGLFTAVFPTLFAKACLYILSRRYTVNVTQIVASARDENKTRQLLWGQVVEKIMYWKPPQANVGLSLTLMSYGDSIQLGVMADALLAPDHSIIVNSFSNHLMSLANSAGVPSLAMYSRPQKHNLEAFPGISSNIRPL